MWFMVERIVLLIAAVKRSSFYHTPVEVELEGLLDEVKESSLMVLAQLSKLIKQPRP